MILGFSSRRINGEKKSSDIDAALNFEKEFKATIEEYNYKKEQIFNCDELGLFFKALERRTIVSQDRKDISGINNPKDRISVLLCSNMTYECKLKPLVIGKFERPRCLKGVNILHYQLFINIIGKA